MGCGTTFVKYVLFFFNLFFAICGLAILGIGIAFKLKLKEITSLLEGKIDTPPVLFIIIGSIVFIVAFFGCCGAVRESHCMTVTYAILMLVIIIVQVVAAILVFVYIGDIEKAISESLKTSFKEVQAGNEAATEAFNTMQHQLECCGLTSTADYSGNLPSSCCAEVPAFAQTCSPNWAYGKGCISALSRFVNTAGKTIGGIAIGVAVVEVIGAIFALCLANSIRNADRRSHY